MRYNDDDESPRRRDEDDDRPRRRRDEDDDREPPARRPAKRGMSTGLIIGIVVGVLLICVAAPILLLLPAREKVRMAAARSRDQSNLKQISIGASNKESATGYLATGPYATDPTAGAPNSGLSFRVDLLPYIEQAYLDKQFRKDEAWDSANNRPLSNTSVSTLASPLDPPGTATTRYRAFVGPGSVFEPGKKVRLTDILDGSSNTIFVVSADEGVIWSKPEELNYTETGPLPKIGQKSFAGGTNVVLCDGSVRFLTNSTSDTVLRALITRNGGEVLPLDY